MAEVPQAKATQKFEAQKGADFIKKSGAKSAKPSGPATRYTLAHGTHKHATAWGKGPDGQQVATEFVHLAEGDEVDLTADELARMDPHGVKFVSADKYRKLKVREELDAEERAETLKKIAANDPTARVPKSPADKLLGNIQPSDDAKEVTRKSQQV